MVCRLACRKGRSRSRQVLVGNWNSISVRTHGGSDVVNTSGDNSFKETGKIIVIFYALINDYITINVLVWLADGNNICNSY